jgi:hypothetical protein
VDTPADLERASALNRERADAVLAAALGLALEPGADPVGVCERLAAGETAEVGPGAVKVAPRDTVGVRVGRFADAPLVQLGRTSGEATLEIPADASARPWRVQVDGAASVCVEP